MNRIRTILGIVAGLAMIASSGAHSLYGWKELGSALRTTQAPADLISTVGIGWRFGGSAMLAFGIIVIALFWKEWKGIPVSLMPAIVIGITYFAFGCGAFVASRFDPFFMVFVIPGLLVLIAALPRPVVSDPR